MSKILNRIQKLADKLAETDYALFDGNFDSGFNLINYCLGTITAYQNSILADTEQKPFIMSRSCTGQERRDRLEYLSMNRGFSHEAMMTAMGQLNRYCRQVGVEEICDVDTEHWQETTDFTGRFISQIFEDGTSDGEDELLQYLKDNHRDLRNTYETKNLLEKILNNGKKDEDEDDDDLNP